MMHRRARRLAWSVLAPVLVGACAGAGDGDADRRVEEFVAGWSSSWASGNAIDTVRFYAPDVAVRLAQPDIEITYQAGFVQTTTNGDGRAWLADWLDKHTNPRAWSIDGLFADRTSAAVVHVIDDLETAVMQVMDMGAEGIALQRTLRWRDAHKPGGAVDDRLGPVDATVSAYLSAWDGGDPNERITLYDEAAVVTDAAGNRLAGHGELLAAGPEWSLPGGRLSAISPGGREGPALFVVPGRDNEQAAFVVATTERDPCAGRVLALLSMSDGRIVSERRFRPVDSQAGCLSASRVPGGWWTDLALPPPIGEEVTGTLAQDRGGAISIVNGTPELERLAAWGLSRFPAVGLVAPVIESITFAPVAECVGVAGAIVEHPAGHPDLLACTDAFAACTPDREACTGYTVSARFGLLHELAHAWMIENLTDSDRSAFLEATGLEAWRDGAVPWHRRGVEVAADTIAWGLLDQRIPLVRFGDPPCATIAARYEMLTGAAPPVSCAG